MQRGDFGIIGRYARQDSYNAETPGGSFDPLDPSFGDNPDSGRARVEQTRDRFQLQPTFSYEVTERARIGITADYQAVRYDSDGVPTDLDYDYAVLDGSATWSLNSVSDLTVGAYASNYQAMTDSLGDVSETDAYGGRVGYGYRWSDVNGVEAELFYESNDVTDLVGARSEFSTSGWGGSLIAYHRQEVSEWRFSVGRTFQPTSDGRKAEFDQFRLQYDRDLSQRLKFLGAARYETRNSHRVQRPQQRPRLRAHRRVAGMDGDAKRGLWAGATATFGKTGSRRPSLLKIIVSSWRLVSGD